MTKAATRFQLLLLLFCSGTSPPHPAQAQPQLSESTRPQPQVLLSSFFSSLIYQELGVLYAFQLRFLKKENVKSGSAATDELQVKQQADTCITRNQQTSASDLIVEFFNSL